jgi:ATP-dependent Lon protease
MLGNRRPVSPGPDGFRELDPHSHVLIPEALRRELLIEREARRQSEEALHAASESPAGPTADSGRQPQARAPEPGQRLPLYDLAQVQAALAALPAAARANERTTQEKALLTRLAAGDPLRPVARPGSDLRWRLRRLRAAFPNFADVLDAVERNLALARCAGEPPVLPPLLLVGEPGVGKSLFVEQLSHELTGQRVSRFQMETSGIVDRLIGTEQHWSTSGTGALFELLVDGPCINPFVMLDELERAPPRQSHAGLVKVLYALLEPESARRFSDQALPAVTLDASYISWIATANSTGSVERPLLDRFQVFHIPAPTLDHAKAIVRRIEATLRRRFGQRRLPELSDDLLEQVATLAPRRVGKLMRELHASLLARQSRAYGQPERDLVAAELKAAAAQAAADAAAHSSGPLSLAEFVQGVMTLSTVSAMKALEIAGKQAWMQQLAQKKGTLH